MTPAALLTYVQQRYNAVGDSFFPDAEIFTHFYGAQMELALETQCIKSIYSTVSVASQRIYDFPSSTQAIERVEYDGERIYPNDFTDDDGLTGNDPDGSITGTPENYQIYGYQLFLRPVPSTSALTIKVFSSNFPSVPTAAGSLDIPAPYHIFLADYALNAMFAKDQNLPMANYHRQQWLAHKQMILASERARDYSDSFKVVKDIDDLSVESRFG